MLIVVFYYASWCEVRGSRSNCDYDWDGTPSPIDWDAESVYELFHFGIAGSDENSTSGLTIGIRKAWMKLIIIRCLVKMHDANTVLLN